MSSRPRTRAVDDEPLSRMGRRRFIETLVGAGFSASMASCLSAEEFETADRDEVPIVYAVARDDPDDPESLTEQTRTVAAEWYDDLQATIDAHASLELIDIDGVLGTSVVPDDAGRGAFIDVAVAETDARDRVLDVVEDVGVDIDLVDDGPSGDETEDEPDHYYDPGAGREVPGGVPCANEDSMATLAPALYDRGSETQFFATANHLYDRNDAASEGDPLYVMTTGEQFEIGRVEQGHPDEDIARVRPTGDLRPASELFDASPGRVGGQFTRIGLADLKARGTEIEKVGAMTGHTSGALQAIDGVTCIYGDPCNDGQIKWGSESDFADGDSGSVAYAPDPEEPDRTLICGLNNARTWWPGENYIWGTGAYVLDERYGYTF